VIQGTPRKPLTLDDPRHGSHAGASAHYSQKIPLCIPCKTTVKAYRTIYYQIPRIKIIAQDRSRQWYQEHKERSLKRAKEWRDNNKEKYEQNRKIYDKEKFKKIYTYRYISPVSLATFYVGKGTIDRNRKHIMHSFWWRPELELIMEEQPSEAHAMETESRWIIDFQPIYNKEGYRR
jgi:hypothetical protein